MLFSIQMVKNVYLYIERVMKYEMKFNCICQLQTFNIMFLFFPKFSNYKGKISLKYIHTYIHVHIYIYVCIPEWHVYWIGMDRHVYWF